MIPRCTCGHPLPAPANSWIGSAVCLQPADIPPPQRPQSATLGFHRVACKLLLVCHLAEGRIGGWVDRNTQWRQFVRQTVSKQGSPVCQYRSHRSIVTSASRNYRPIQSLTLAAPNLISWIIVHVRELYVTVRVIDTDWCGMHGTCSCCI